MIVLLVLLAAQPALGEDSGRRDVIERARAAIGRHSLDPRLGRLDPLALPEHPPWADISASVRAPWCLVSCSVSATWVSQLPDGSFAKVVCCLRPGELGLIAPDPPAE